MILAALTQVANMSVGFSRLSPSFEDVVNDPLLLSYFVQFLRSTNSENIFRFWLELSGYMSRNGTNDDNFQFETEESVLPDSEIKNLHEKISNLHVNDVTTIYFRYISPEAKLSVQLYPKLLSTTLCTRF